MTSMNLVVPLKNGKPDWLNKDLLIQIAAIMRTSRPSTELLAKELKRLYQYDFSENKLNGALNRPVVRKRFEEVIPDGKRLLAVRTEASVQALTQNGRTTGSGGWKPLNFRSTPVKAPPPKRAMNEQEQQNNERLEAYFADIARREGRNE